MLLLRDLFQSGVVDDAVYLDLGAPEAVEDVLIRHQRGKVEPAPAVQADPAEQPQQAVGLVISVRPQFRGASRNL